MAVGLDDPDLLDLYMTSNPPVSLVKFRNEDWYYLIKACVNVLKACNLQ